MRVLVVPKWYPWPDRPVFGSFCREQALALATRHDVVVLASEAVRSPDFAAFQLADSVEPGGLRTFRLRYRRPRFRPAAMGFQLAGMLAALVRLRRAGWRPQVVHAHVYSAGPPALVLGALSRAPVVITEHFTGFQRGLITGYDRLTARVAFHLADLVAPVSEDLATHVRALAPGTAIEVVGNVVDTEVFHPPPDPLPQPSAVGGRLLTVAAMAEKKGHRHLLEALASMPAGARPVLELVGDGELRADLEARAQALGLGESVRFRGELPKEEVAALMRRVHVFVLPSLFENLPCVLIEAMASGLPCVATAVGGVPELLGEHGLLCPPGDPPALARAIAGALDALGQRDQQAVATAPAWADAQSLARETRERFVYEAFARRWTGIYERLLDERRTGTQAAGSPRSSTIPG